MSILRFGDYAGDFYGDEHCRWENTRRAPLCSGRSFRLCYRASGQNKTGRGFDGVSDDRKLDASGVISAILVSTFPCRKPHPVRPRSTVAAMGWWLMRLTA